jgi:hypothetical protein
MIGVNTLDLNSAVVGGGPSADRSELELASPTFFGTAFPILPELLVMIAHVVRAVRDSGGNVALCRSGPRSRGIRSAVHLADDVELFDDPDLALVRCDGHSRNLTPVNIRIIFALHE